MNQKSLSRFESLAQRLVEGSFRHLFGGQMELLEIATRIAQVMEDSSADGRPATVFIVTLHPDDYAEIRAQTPNVSQALADYTLQLAQQAGLVTAQRPSVRLRADAAVRRRRVHVTAEPQADGARQDTKVYAKPNDEEAVLAALRQLEALLIIEGRRHVTLDRPLVSLGRRADNDVVLDSPAVSRRHAQIRWRNGRFVLYDVSGRGRTRVNGDPVSECVLHPGDVIALSDVLVIYAEGTDAPQLQRPTADGDHTQTYVPRQRS